ncbi:MAG: tryptophan-rich sensory protein [Bacteroidetes bacterium]|nr:tryptophan-rich sensory protein [Bacteroidota bacterium]MBK8659581.1 tryptophan-rich sensory protein [Bacteroidota bacterium]
MNFKKIIQLILCISLPMLIGGASGFATASSLSDWYLTINKPSFNPPNWVFGPVWTVLYLLMGISLFLILKSENAPRKRTAILVFLFQLTLNFWWSIIFFSLESPAWALLEIVLLWCSILLMIFVFRKINHTAAYLQIPYLVWVNFAAILNAAIWYLN